MFKKAVLISTTVLGFMHFIPGADALAKESVPTQNLKVSNTEFNLDKQTLTSINEVLEEQEINWGEIEKLNTIANESLTLVNEDRYVFDSSKALELGLTPEQATNLKNGYESLSSSEVLAFENIKKDKVEFPGPDPISTVVPVIITVGALINALLAIGAAWLVTIILELGVDTACKRWKYSSKAPKIFKAFCDMKGW
ncbi:hypothetical protein [Bacillus sp. Brlt_9]|uniref:hypothetical protein n=1 Tax=Bacillus sp. Brlt_9 TaxID=3110916 RepID=UPI003F7CA0B1